MSNAVSFTLDRTSAAYRRITKAGFTINDLTITEGKDYNTHVISTDFTCVCGKKEYLQFIYHPWEDWVNSKIVTIENNLVDIAALLENIGAVSVKHLQDDGYTEEQIKQIRAAYEYC